MPALEISEDILAQYADIVYKNSGIIFKDSNAAVLISRISSKMKEKNSDVKTYLEQLKTDKNELLSFIDFVTTNFTSFFRNQRHFELLDESILPGLINSKYSRQLKIWSAGCSTSEETYSIAITVKEFFEKNHIDLASWDIKIMGSDISLESLFIAKEAKYPDRSVQKIPPAYIQKYFTPLEDGKYYIVKDEIKKMVKFDFHNLMYGSGIDAIDITFCRNVLIYFDEDIQKKVLTQIYNSTNDNGFLFIGHSESLVGLFDKFKPTSFEKGIIYVKQ